MVWLILTLLLLTGLLALLIPMLYAGEVYRVRRGLHRVTCPETKKRAAVEIDALHCAATSLTGSEYMRLSDCSRWPEKKDCDQECVYELFEPETPPAAKPGLPHVAVWAGAGAAWLLGAFWYADPVFGRAWVRLHGLGQEAARARAEAVAPYLVPLAGFLLLGYVVALAERVAGRLGMVRAIALAVAACAAFLVVDLLLRPAFPGEWLPLTWVEMTYALAGSALSAAVVSGWPALRQEVGA
ncbi:MAG TPA: DUF1761 family protein [Terriglobales bacterium]|nr:DUF1761 family protein [Terriglobales bacterium]